MSDRRLRGWWMGGLVMLCSALTPCASAVAQSSAAYQEAVAKYGDAATLFSTGQYANAILVLQAMPKGDSTWLAGQPMLVRSLAMIGRYDEAERVGREAAAVPGGKAILNTLGETLLLRGKRAAAESSFAGSPSAGFGVRVGLAPHAAAIAWIVAGVIVPSVRPSE